MTLNTPLIPITLKEAALDSPTFRGIVQGYGEQVENFEKWLDGYLKAATKLCSEMHVLEDLVNAFLQKSTPNNAFELVLDYDYTHLAIRRFAQSSREYWNSVLGGVKRLEQTTVESLLQVQRGELKSFKELRRQLESAQYKYDSLLARYASQSKTKEPSSLREDAFQVYEARKLYLRLCFDFCIAAPSIRSTLDRTITRVLSDQWRDYRNVQIHTAAALENYGAEMERIRHWTNSLELGEKALKNELLRVRRETEEKIKQDLHPARDIEEYSASTVPYLTSNSVAVNAKTTSCTDKFEKQGWLFMRSLASKQTRVWIRRWFFIKDGMFGYLMQGYRNGRIEESEKIGVLLCNIKPAFHEDRRFCFEVKTKDVSILLQAEIQTDLTAWIEVFEQAKRKAVEASARAGQAFSVVPPSAPAPELSVRDHAMHDENINIGFDRSLTLPLSGQSPDGLKGTILGSRTGDGSKVKTSDARQLLHTGTSGFGGLISTYTTLPVDFRGVQAPGSSGDGPPSLSVPSPTLVTSLAPTTLAYGPAPNGLARAAVVTGSPLLPDFSDLQNKKHKKTVSLDMKIPSDDTNNGPYDTASTANVAYPPNYPGALKAQDLHFRFLFPSMIIDQPVLLVFRASWATHNQNELPGRCFVTMDNIYFYSHYFGFVYRKSLHLSDIEDVTATSGKDCDHLFFHLRPGDPDDSDCEDEAGDVSRMDLKVFLEPVRLLQRRLHLLIKNANVLGERIFNKDLVERLIGLELEPKQKATLNCENPEDIYPDRTETVSRNKAKGSEPEKELIIPNEGPEFADRSRYPGNKEQRVKLPTEPIIYEPRGMDRRALETEFDVPAKSLFHVMFGHKSVVFQTLYYERRARHIHQGSWIPANNGKLKREFNYEIEYTDFLGRPGRTNVADYQIIDTADDYLCYVVTDRKTPWHLPHKDQFMLISKIIITYVTKSKCKLAIWTAVEWSRAPALFKGIIQRQAFDDLDTDALDLGDVVSDQIRRIGTENRIKNAIAIFGQVNRGASDQGYENDASAIEAERCTNAGGEMQRRITQHSLTYMMMENVLSLGESALSTILMGAFGLLQKGWEIISAQRIFIILLAFSIAGNFVLGSRSTISYWTELRAAQFVRDVGVKPNSMMSKAIYLKDIEDLVKNGTELALFPSKKWYGNGASSTPHKALQLLMTRGHKSSYSKFRELSVQHESDTNPSYWDTMLQGHPTQAMARKLTGKRQALGTYRHDLLVALRLINNLERQVIKSEWENWLLIENIRCRQALNMLKDMKQRRSKNRTTDYSGVKTSGLGFEEQPVPKAEDEVFRDRWNVYEEASIEEVAQWVVEYCSSCDAERYEVLSEGKRLQFT